MAATDVGATAAKQRRGGTVSLPVQSRATSLPLAFGGLLRADPGTQFAVVGWLRMLAPGDYRVELAFRLPRVRSIREKALYAASISCGGSRYFQPILPIVTSMAQVPGVTVDLSASSTKVTVPRIAQASATRTLSCAR